MLKPPARRPKWSLWRVGFILLVALAGAASPAFANLFNAKMTEHGIWPYHDRVCR